MFPDHWTSGKILPSNKFLPIFYQRTCIMTYFIFFISVLGTKLPKEMFKQHLVAADEIIENDFIF